MRIVRRIVRIVLGIILVIGAVFLAIAGSQVLFIPKVEAGLAYRVIMGVVLWVITAILGAFGYQALKILWKKKKY